MWLCCCELGVRGREAAHPQPCAVTRTGPGTVQAPNSREPESPSLLVKRAKCKVSPGTAPGCGLQAEDTPRGKAASNRIRWPTLPTQPFPLSKNYWLLY